MEAHGAWRCVGCVVREVYSVRCEVHVACSQGASDVGAGWCRRYKLRVEYVKREGGGGG